MGSGGRCGRGGGGERGGERREEGRCQGQRSWGWMLFWGSVESWETFGMYDLRLFRLPRWGVAFRKLPGCLSGPPPREQQMDDHRIKSLFF